jgi:hypothetical protein
MRIGVDEMARMRRQTSSPDIFGRPRSRITRSGDSSAWRLRAASPSYAVTTSYPSSPRSAATMPTIARSSSTTSTLVTRAPLS